MRIGIYGTGRFGRFWAETLARHAEVVTWSRTPRPVPKGSRAVSLAELSDSDCVMLCVAIHAVPEATRSLVPHLRPDCVLMDTCSVKVFPVQSMMENAPAEVEVIGTHPMFGPDSAAGGVTDLPMVMSKARCHPSTFIRYHEFFTGIGLRVVEMSPEEHDREAAMTQGVTHFLGRVLADLGLEPSSIATMGYQKLLEVMEQTCNDPYELFVDLQRYNPYTSLMRERLKESLAAVMGTLERPLDSGEEHP